MMSKYLKNKLIAVMENLLIKIVCGTGIIYLIIGVILATIYKILFTRQYEDTSWLELIVKWPGTFGILFE
jgi:hypothetical protein